MVSEDEVRRRNLNDALRCARGISVSKIVLRPTRRCPRRRPFVPMTTDLRHARRVVPNLARGLVLTGLDRLSVGHITYMRPAVASRDREGDFCCVRLLLCPFGNGQR